MKSPRSAHYHLKNFIILCYHEMYKINIPQSKVCLPSRNFNRNNCSKSFWKVNIGKLQNNKPINSFQTTCDSKLSTGALRITLNHHRHTLVLRCMNHCLEFSGKTDMGFIPIILILHHLRKHPHME